MIKPSIVDLLEKVDNKYSLIYVISKRATELINGEMPLVEGCAMNPVTTAAEEIIEGKLTYYYE